MQSDTETLSREAQPLANPEGIAALTAQVEDALACMAQATAKLVKAQERPQMLQARHRELNEQNTRARATSAARAVALLDEYVLGDPPLAEFAAQFSAVRAQSDFLDRATQRLVVIHMQLAQRGVLEANHAVADARADLIRLKALLAMARRHILIGPLVVHEREIKIEGGLTEVLSREAMAAAVAKNKAAQAIADHDKRVEEMHARLSL